MRFTHTAVRGVEWRQAQPRDVPVRQGACTPRSSAPHDSSSLAPS